MSTIALMQGKMPGNLRVRQRLLIVGSGMAAARLLEELAARDCADEITVVGEEPDPSYNRILLSSMLCGEKTPAELPLLDRQWYRAHGVLLLTGEAVTRVDVLARVAWTSRSRRIRFDRLVFATGARGHLPVIPGVASERVLAFRTLQDLAALRRLAVPGEPAVVVGGGLLGLEAAHGLAALGLAVTVVHRQPYPMNRQLDPQAGALLQQQLERRGIRFALGASPVSVGSLQGAVASVRLDDGRSLPARLVVFAAGIAPNVEVAATAGVPCGRAIRVDRWLRTGVPAIHALGECCEMEGRGFGLVAPVWRQAQVLADVLTGRASAGFAHVEDPVQLKVSGIELFSAGAMPFPADAESQVLQDAARGIYRRLVFAGGKLVGAILLGDRRGGSWYGELIAAGQDVSVLRPRLIFGREFCGAPADAAA